MTTRVQDINSRQNDADHMRLLRAASATHASVAAVERVRWIFAAVVVIVLFLATFIDLLEPLVALASVLLAVLSEVGGQILVRNLSERAATIQEQFDVSLLAIPKNATRPPLPRTTLSRLASEYKGRDEALHDWYLDVRGIPGPVASALCQRQNLLWDSDLRADWAFRLISVVGAYLSLGMIISCVFDWSVRVYLSGWVVPALPLLVPAATAFALQRQAVRVRRGTLDVLTHALERAAKTRSLKQPQKVARQVQDAIFETRRDAPRVPNWFYTRKKDSYELSFEVDAAGYRSRWASYDGK